MSSTGDAPSTGSISSLRTMMSDRSDSHGVRASLEGALDKLRSPSSSNDSLDGPAREHHGLHNLLPRRIRSKRRHRREQRKADEHALAEAQRGRHIAERGYLEDDPSDSEETESVSSRASSRELDSASLLVVESEDESPCNVPPPLASHQSHTGYLTTSSPLIKSSNLPASESPSMRPSNRIQDTSAGEGPSDFPSIPVPSFTTASLQPPNDVSSKRTSSPVGKLKDAFVRRATSPNPSPDPSPSHSPERKPKASLAVRKEKDTGSTVSRRSSVSSRFGSIFTERQPPPKVEVQAPERPRISRAPYSIDTKSRPSTPPTSENAAPVIVNTPPTPTDVSSPPRFSASPGSTISPNPNVVTSPSGNMISHRRVRSGSGASASIGPSKLSNIISAPLTPTPENGPNPPGGAPQTGFFSTVMSAAQNAANTFSNSISNNSLPGQARIRSNTQDGTITPMDDVEVESPDDSRIRSDEETKELAVKTLGKGDLSLSALGIVETTSGGNTPTSAKFGDNQQVKRGRAATVGQEDLVHSANTPTLTFDKADPMSPNNDYGAPARPWSAHESSVAGDQSPANGSIFEEKLGRDNSIRSALEASKRRKRGSSAATGTTVGAATPTGTATSPKVTGFAVASKKRNHDFHQLFRSVPDDDYLIEDYSCALQREILAHGRLYVSEGHLCFSSNIFGWVTTLVMSFDEIVSVEKRNTALLFKNGLMISTLHSKNIFASFTSRDSTYDLIVDIWKLGHPSLRSSLNGVRIEETGGGDKTEKDDGRSESAGSGTEEDSEDEIYDEDEEEEDDMSFTNAGGSIAASETLVEKGAPRKISAPVTNGAAAEKKEATPIAAVDFPGPTTHGATECSDQDTHYDKVIADEIIQAPLGKIYNLMFGTTSVIWMSRWLTVEQKCLELQMEDKKGLGADNKVRTYSYIKPLNGAIGPRQTKCIITENLDTLDFDKCVSVTMSTATPDVPSGNVFTTKTKYCLSWAENNATRLQMNCTIEWTGKSWLKGPIEKGANDGQVAYAKDLVASLKSAVATRARAGTGPTGRGKRKGGRRAGGPRAAAGATSGVPVVSKAPPHWGVAEPLRGVLGPVADVCAPLVSGNMVYGLLVGLLVAAWFGFGRGPPAGGREVGMGRGGPGMFFANSAERVVAYEEIWRREESELWEWLEARTGAGCGWDAGGRASEDVRRGLENRLGREGEGAGEREVEEAIRVTEEKLRALRGVVGKRKVEREREREREKE